MNKRWKKATALLLTGVTALSLLAACGQDPNKETTGSTGNTQDTTESVLATTTVPTQSPEERGYYLAEDYIANPDLFVPSWADEWQPPEEMLDFEEKYESFFTPNGRMMSIAHRGDRNVLYPENSIEAILSVIMAGADIVEIDVILTKDGIPVVIHDDDLLRTTNITLMRLNGQADHLPSSNNVSDWTLEQLRELRLTMESGDGTNYVIPTLRDVIMVCKDRCFVYLDKVSRIDWSRDVMPIIDELGAYRTVIIPYTYNSTVGFGTVFMYNKRIKNASGYDAAFAAGAKADTIAEVVAGLEENNLCKAVRIGEYSPNDPDYVAQYADYLGKYRFVCETLTRSNDFPEVWAEMADYGFNTVMTNVNPYELQKFIAERYFS